MASIQSFLSDQANADLRIFHARLLQTDEYGQLIEMNGRCCHVIVVNEVYQRFLEVFSHAHRRLFSSFDTDVIIECIVVNGIETQQKKEKE